MKTHYTIRIREPRRVRIHLSAARIEIDDRARADDNCAKSFGQAQQQMVIDKAINHSFRSRELYWPLQALRVVLINVKADVNVTAETPPTS